jgi:pyruvate kinase
VHTWVTFLNYFRPAVTNANTIIKLLDAGMTVARFNMRHGTEKQRTQLIKKFYDAKRLRPYKTCALMMDLRGRSCRISHSAKPLEFLAGDKVEIRSDGYEIASTQQEIQINLYDLAPLMREGDEIIFGSSGTVKAMVTEVNRTSFFVDFIASGTIESCAVVKLPAPRVS